MTPTSSALNKRTAPKHIENPKTVFDGEIIVGKDILELLSSSMYINPLTIYREYIQNSTDAIDAAVDADLLHPDEGRVEFKIDPSERRVVIRDNGIGLASKNFTKRMTAFGASQKKGTCARGFRGVGRLAGLGYCQELIFRSQAPGKNVINEISWDCRRLKALLSDADFKGDLNDIVHEVVSIQNYNASSSSDHFFEVEIQKPLRLPRDVLLNEVAIDTYLSQIAPVPFDPHYRFATETNDALSEHLQLGEFQIYLGNSRKPIYRPYKNFVPYSDERKGSIESPQFFQIESIDGSVAAVGWILHHDYQGAIPESAGVKGLRARVGNIQVGGHDIFAAIFPEARFSSWTIGEVHIVDRNVVPNGRRDNFEQNSHLSNLINRLVPFAHDIARRCRGNSMIRNRIKGFEIGEKKIVKRLEIIEQRAVPKNSAAAAKKEIGSLLSEIKKAANFGLINEGTRAELLSRFEALEKWVSSISGNQDGKDPLSNLSKRERQTFEKVFGLIYECSVNHVAAKSLIDRILARISHV